MLDTHVHLIEPGRFSYPWLGDVPDLGGAWTLDDWSDQARRAGVSAGLFMEVDAALDDMAREAAHYCSVAADPDTMIVGVIAACRPESDQFERHLEAIENPGLSGLRRVLHVAPEGTLDSPHLIDNLRLVGLHDLPFDLCVRADQLPKVLPIVDACPHTQFVLDHCGNPPVGTPELEIWAEDIRQVAFRPNVVCKVSGLVNHVPETSDPATALRPVFDHVAEVFGTHRLVFGGDWPVSTLKGIDLVGWAAIARGLSSGWSPEERAALFEENARRIYSVLPS